MSHRHLTALLFLSMFGAACNQPASAGMRVDSDGKEREPPRLITVTGTATLQVTPDVLDVRMNVTAEALHPREAVTQLRAKQAKLLAGMKKAGIEGSDLDFSQLNLGPFWDADGRRIAGYRASLSALVSTKDFDRLGDIVENAAEAGATEISTSSRRSDLDEQKKKVRTMALDAAKEKATQSAQVLGITLSRVNMVSEMASGYWWGGDGSNVANAMGSFNTSMGRTLSPEATPLTLMVTIAYEIG